MANSLVQFRADENMKNAADNVCRQLGIDLPTYMRMCISRLVQENGIPFSMNLDELEVNKGIRAMKEASKIAKQHGISDMSLE